MRYAQVRIADGVVLNVVEADEAWAAEQATDEAHFVADPEGQADIGGTYEDGEFSRPGGE